MLPASALGPASLSHAGRAPIPARFQLLKDGTFVKRLSPFFVLVLLVVLCTLAISSTALGTQNAAPGPLPYPMTPSSQVEPPEGLSAQDWSQILALLPATEAPQDLAAAGALLAQGSLESLDQQAYLKASNTDAYDNFGDSVAVCGDTVVVGAPWEDSSATGVGGNQDDNNALDAGAAYVFVRSGTAWSQQAYLKASNAGAGDGFGGSVAVSGDTVVVGASNEDSSAGAAYVFVRSGTAWSQQAYLKASNPGASDRFGISVAVSGDTVVVGAHWEDSSATGVGGKQDDNNALEAGAAYVFVRSGTAWSQQAYLKASNAGAGDGFGFSVAVSGDTVVVGASGEDSGATGVGGNQDDNNASFSGAAYVFVRSGTTWSQQAYLKASNTGAGDEFGCSVAVSGDTVVVGALDEDGSVSGAGAAYVFVRSGTTWSQQAYLKASNPGAGDEFGSSVAVSGDTVVVGARDEGGSASDAGAAYVFVRSGTAWSQQAYLKASRTDVDDSFGCSVAVSGDTVVVGAQREDSNAAGVNGDDSNNDVDDAGAAYVFVQIYHTLTYLSTSGGSLQGDTLQIVSEGADGTPVLAVPDEGYLFAGWSDWVRDNPRTDIQVTSNITVRARFAPIPEPPLPVVYSVSAAVTQGEGSVSPAAQWVLAGKSATIDITSAPGYHLSEITVDGKRVPLANPFIIADVADHHRVQIGFAPDEVPIPFAVLDVPQDHELYPAIVYLAERGIIAGYGDGNFGPYDPILRAQVAKMLVLALGGDWGHPYGDIPDFIDVPNDGSPYPYSFVMSAARAGVVVGYADGRFRPYKAITRMQLVRMVVRAASELLEEPPAGYDPGFADVTDATDRALLAKAHYNGLIDGTAPGTFSPAMPATRGEAAYALYRVLLLKEQGPQ